MVQYGSDGKVIPHYYGENYRGFDIFPTYRCLKGKLVKIWMGRNPFDDTNICEENLLKSPKHGYYDSREQIVEFIDKYTFLAQPGNENLVLCSSDFEYYEEQRSGKWVSCAPRLRAPWI